jgi:hypothetical protein
MLSTTVERAQGPEQGYLPPEEAGDIVFRPPPSVCDQSQAGERVALDPENVEKGLAQLVLTLVELLRRLLERQAIRRIDSGTLSDLEIERMGDTFIKLEARVAQLKDLFKLSDEELNINLGPLGDLM